MMSLRSSSSYTAALGFIASLLLLSSGGPTLVAGQQRTGDITAYGDDWRGGACLYQDLPAAAQKHFVAINQVLWDKLGLQGVCGRCAKISYGSTTVTGMITNRCPECAETALDLSDTLFKDLTGSYPSRLTATWELVDCDDSVGITGDVGFYTKDGVNDFWLAIQPLNFQSPISQISIEYPAGSGNKKEMEFHGDSALNYYISSSFALKGSFTLEATDGTNTYSATVNGVKASSYIPATRTASSSSVANTNNLRVAAKNFVAPATDSDGYAAKSLWAAAEGETKEGSTLRRLLSLV